MRIVRENTITLIGFFSNHAQAEAEAAVEKLCGILPQSDQSMVSR